VFVQDDPVKLAIKAKERERDELAVKIAALEKDLKQKRERLNSLDNFINEGKVLLGLETKAIESKTKASRSPPSSPRPTSSAIIYARTPVVQKVVALFRELRRPLTANEIVAEFQKRKWKISNSYGPDVIRMSLRPRPDLFEKDPDGFFSLKDSE
jgi:hypothetical protein